MTAIARKAFVGVLLAFCMGVQILEVSGRWDQTFRDANDEAGIVAIVLCVGIAIAVARTLLAQVHFTRSPLHISAVVLRDGCIRALTPTPPGLIGSPPTALRI